MQNDPRSLYRRFALGATGLTALAVLLRSLSLCLFFDRTVGYVDTSVFSTLLYIVLALFALGCAVYAILATRLEKTTLTAVSPDEAAATPAVRYTALLCALTFLSANAAEVFLTDMDSTLSLLRFVGAIVAMLYFALPQKTGRTALLGLGVLLYGVGAIAGEYFDWTVALNSPIKLMQEAALLSAMFFTLVEINHFNHTRRSVRYTVCAASCLFCGLTNGLSLIAAALVGGIVKPVYLIHALPPLAIGLYAAVRLFAGHEITLPEPVEETEESPDTEAEPQAADTEQPPDNQDEPQPTSQEEEYHG